MTATELKLKLYEFRPHAVRPYFVENDLVYIYCPRCSIWKNTEAFSSMIRKGKNSVFEFRTECKVCQLEKHRKYLALHPSKAKEFEFRRKAKKLLGEEA